MINQDTRTRSVLSLSVERNVFGYILNALLATAWLSLFLSIAGFQLISSKCDIFGLCETIDTIPRVILLFASLLLGGFHANILRFDVYAKNKKVTASLKSWYLILGTILYLIASYLILTRDYQTKFNYKIILFFLAFSSFPMIFCILLLVDEDVFSPWIISKSTEDVIEWRLVGFIVYIFLALIWLIIAIFALLILCFAELDKEFIFSSSFFLVFICSLSIFGVHLYSLCTPKYDSGDASNGFFKKKWLMISSCTFIILPAIFFIVALSKSGNGDDIVSFTRTMASLIVLSLCSCLVIIPSNSSKSLMRYLKPWNTLRKEAKAKVD